jgi:hypothetical protein
VPHPNVVLFDVRVGFHGPVPHRPDTLHPHPRFHQGIFTAKLEWRVWRGHSCPRSQIDKLPSTVVTHGHAGSQGTKGGPSVSRSEGRGCSAGAVSFLRVVCSRSPTARNSSLTSISEPQDLPFSSHISCTLITDTQSQSRNNSPTLQHRKLRPSPETDPLSAANHFGGSLTKGQQVHKLKQQKRRLRTPKSARQTAVSPAKSLFM